MEIKVVPSNDVTVVEIPRRIIAGEPVVELDKVLFGLLRAERVNTVLDFTDVIWYDSSAIQLADEMDERRSRFENLAN